MSFSWDAINLFIYTITNYIDSDLIPTSIFILLILATTSNFMEQQLITITQLQAYINIIYRIGHM